MACTTFMLSKDGPTLVAKSYDWQHEDGIIHRNPAGLRKKGLLLSQSERPVEWVSRYASLSFNQYGREMPNGGMNDAGLVVEIMWLEGAGWPAPDDRPALNELQWIQYQLDMYATTREVVEGANAIRVAPIHGEVHYMVCDPSGECASLEYLGGELVIHHGDSMPIPALTNSTYARSAASVRSRPPDPKDMSSLGRFRRAASITDRSSSLDLAWETLDSVQWKRTQWQIVYDPENLQVYFRTRGNRAIRKISLPAIPAVCGPEIWTFSMQEPVSGSVDSRFTTYDPERNHALVRTGVAQLNSSLPQEVVHAVSSISQHFVCDN